MWALSKLMRETFHKMEQIFADYEAVSMGSNQRVLLRFSSGRENGLDIHDLLTCSFLSNHPQAFSFILPLKCIQIKDAFNRQKETRFRAVQAGKMDFQCQSILTNRILSLHYL